MKLSNSLIAMLFAFYAGTCLAAPGVADDEIGLSKTSVYDVPVPEPFTYSENIPGANPKLERSYHTAPPMIPHKVSDLVPVTAKLNKCLGCHHNPALLGIEGLQGVAPPAPKGHYKDPRSGEENMKAVDGSHYVCTQCHAPQAGVTELVGSDF
ncbi:MAG: nitrate reductase cytochrome c-type subunit [Pseudomonadota bacterium]